MHQNNRNKLEIPKIALGTWSWGTGARGGDVIFGNHLGEKDLRPVFDQAMKAGLNLWDTAAVYGMNASENILGNFIKDRNDVLLSTKFTPQIASDKEEAVEELLDGSLERLNAEFIDIYWIHNPADVEKWTPKLITLLKKGKVKNVGVSNHNLREIKRVNEILSQEGFKIAAVQNHYSLLYRSSEEAGILSYCLANNIKFFSYMVLEQGALTDSYDANNPLPKNTRRGEAFSPDVLSRLDELIQKMHEIGEKYERANAAQIAISWAIAKGTVPIIGVTKPKHIEDVVEAIRIELSSEEVLLLEEAAKKTGVTIRGDWEKEM